MARGGSIPAGAGEPSAGCSSRSVSRVYPRGCGGTDKGDSGEAADGGLSPRVRGNLRRARRGEPCRGSIPAGAGEPGAQSATLRSPGVYPRGCGGTQKSCSTGGSTRGLSPRVRGNLGGRSPESGRLGSIPAGAGEPVRSYSRITGDRVYPRGCGGTLVFPLGDQGRRGSIPAGAGEPAPHDRKTSRGSGLSPRVRGNRLRDRQSWPHRGSIPAGAGEPYASRGTQARRRVYPRGCGGTDYCHLLSPSGVGLSPRVRGNLRLRLGPDEVPGSIPAGAGEPTVPNRR